MADRWMMQLLTARQAALSSFSALVLARPNRRRLSLATFAPATIRGIAASTMLFEHPNSQYRPSDSLVQVQPLACTRPQDTDQNWRSRLSIPPGFGCTLARRSMLTRWCEHSQLAHLRQRCDRTHRLQSCRLRATPPRNAEQRLPQRQRAGTINKIPNTMATITAASKPPPSAGARTVGARVLSVPVATDTLALPLPPTFVSTKNVSLLCVCEK